MTDTAAPSTEQLVRVFLRIRSARSEAATEYKKKDDALKAQLSTVEMELLRRAQAEKVTGYTTKDGTTYISPEMHVSIADDQAFYDFVRETGDLEFFERRVTVAHVKEYMEEHEGEVPPGLNLFRENRMRVRASKKKGTADGNGSDD